MSMFSNFRLAFNPNYDRHFRTPVWTCDFDPGVEVSGLLEKAEFEKEYVFDPPREKYKQNSSPLLDQLMSAVSTELDSIFPKIISSEQDIIGCRWLRDSKDILKGTQTHTKIFKDIPKFDMGAHLDNNFMVGNVIVNLVDNENSTAFHDYRKPDKILFKAPREKNKGVIFLNTPGCLHSIKNTSARNRYMMNTSFFIKGLA